MGICLTPASWSPSVERREVPFRSGDAVECRDELFERIAVWECWITQFGGRIFAEPRWAAPVVEVMETMTPPERLALLERSQRARLAAQQSRSAASASRAMARRLVGESATTRAADPLPPPGAPAR